MSATATLEAPKEKPEAKEGKEKAKTNHDAAHAVSKETQDKVAKAAGKEMAEVHSGDDHQPYKRPKFLEITKGREAPSWGKVAKTVGVAAAVAAPPVVIPAYLGAKAVSKTWGFLKKFPVFSTIDKVGRSALGTGKELLSTAWETVTYFPVKAKEKIVNGMKHTLATADYLRHHSWEFLKDIVHITPGETKNLIEHLVHTVFAGVNATLGAVTNFIPWYKKMLLTHPKSTLAGTAAVTGVLAASGGPIAFSKGLMETVLKILQKIAGAAPVAPAI